MTDGQIIQAINDRRDLRQIWRRMSIEDRKTVFEAIRNDPAGDYAAALMPAPKAAKRRQRKREC